MTSVTRSGGILTPIIGIRLDSPFIRYVFENASAMLSNIIIDSECWIQKMKEIISQQSIADNMQTIYHFMGGLWNDTLIEARRFDSELRFLNGYLQYDDWMHDYIQPYMNVI